MKKPSFFSILFFVILCFLFSCKNQDEVVLNSRVMIKSQLAKIPMPPKEEILNAVGSGGPLKVISDGYTPATLVEIFPLDSTTYFVGEKVAKKFFVYYEFNSDGYRTKFLTIIQEFPLTGDGKIVETEYRLIVEIGCSLNREFHLSKYDYVTQIVYFFHSDDGKQFAYYGNVNDVVKLPPIAHGNWKLKMTFNDGDLTQSFFSKTIDFSSNSDTIQLDYGIKNENILSVFSINKRFIKRAFRVEFIGFDEKEQLSYFSQPCLCGDDLNESVIFNLPLKIVTKVIIYGDNYDYNLTSPAPLLDDNKTYYVLE